MDKKLCELSKPVAWKIHNDDHCFLEIREEEAAAYGRMGKKFDPIYSQEYVSALLAELEAKLAQPVSQDYKLPPHVFRELVNALRDTAMKYQGMGQLREQLSRTLSDAGWLETAPDAVDIFADQIIGTKTKIIRMPAPLNVPQEGIRVYLNADELFMHLEKQGYIVEVSNE
jgi:hypothetical protein